MPRIHIHMHGDMRISVFLPERAGRSPLCAEGAQAVEISAVCTKRYMGAGTRMVLVGLRRARKFKLLNKRPCTSRHKYTARNAVRQIVFAQEALLFPLYTVKCPKILFSRKWQKRCVDRFYFLRLLCRSGPEARAGERWFRSSGALGALPELRAFLTHIVETS